MRLLALVLIVACDAGRPAAPKPPAIRDAPALAVVPVPSGDAGLVLSAEDLRFRSAVFGYTKSRNRFLAGWGTVRLDGVHPLRVATVMNYEFRNDSRGGYLIELGPKRYVEVLFAVDGRTQAFDGGDGVKHPIDEVPWTISDAVGIDHSAGHHHGGEGFSFGLRHGQLVLFAYDYIDDTTDVRTKVNETFADATGTCTRGCPPLANHAYRDSSLSVSEPAESIAALVDPEPAPWPEDP